MTPELNSPNYSRILGPWHWRSLPYLLFHHSQEKNQGRPEGIEGFPNSSISFLFSQITIKATEPVNVANNVYFFWYFNFNTVYLFILLYLFLWMWSKSQQGLKLPVPVPSGQAHFHSGCWPALPCHQASWWSHPLVASTHCSLTHILNRWPRRENNSCQTKYENRK